MSKHQFETEVTQLLDLIVHSLYSHKEVFLRELISNATDALDKLKYLTISDDSYKDLDAEFRIDIEFDEENRSMITIRDTGIGMNEEELRSNLGTIARSGTRNFLSQLNKKDRKSSNLIGQFGVGFYSSFMVASKVEVVSRKVGEEQAWRWKSDGKSSFEISKSVRDVQGTTVTLFLNDEGKEFASRWSIESTVEKYSNHVQFPIYLHYTTEEKPEEPSGEKEPAEKSAEKAKKKRNSKQINTAAALWKRPKSEITAEEYSSFYSSISGDASAPLLYLHTQAEGAQEYVALLYVPEKAPADLFHVDYMSGIKLYIQRVFITDDKRELMPSYLRFLRGIIDSEDLPLNVSREMLQENRILTAIRSATVKRFLNELMTISEKDPDTFLKFSQEYNKVLKEGLYSDFENKDLILKLIRFKSSDVDGFTSLADYKARMSSEQKYIYYISGANENMLKHSALVAGYRERSLEVLLMDDEIDDMVLPGIGKYEDLEFRAINRSGSLDEQQRDAEKDTVLQEKLSSVLTKAKEILGERVQDVQLSSLLIDAPSCIVWKDSDPNLRMQQVMKMMGNQFGIDAKPILELALRHPVVEKLALYTSDDIFTDLIELLYEQAMISEGGTPADPLVLSRSLTRVLEKALG